MSSSSEPEEAEGLTDGANDVVVVEQPDGTLRATEWHVQARNQTVSVLIVGLSSGAT